MGPHDGMLMVEVPGRKLDSVMLREDLSKGQRIAAWTLELQVGHPDGSKSWQQAGAGSTIGSNRILPVPAQNNVFAARFSPTLSTAKDGFVHLAELSVYFP